MKAWQYNNSGPAPRLLQVDVARPTPAPGELLIQVYAAGVTPTEVLWYPTTHIKSGEPRPFAIPGHEFSGVVAEAGPGANYRVGQEVFGMNDWFAEGAMAEFCCAPPSAITPKPPRLTHAEAASIPISALTAWQGLFDRAKLQSGERVLIHGGAGAVGVFAIQLANWRGAHVITTASERNRAFLQQLGAQQVIDYHAERFEDLAKEMDVVFDTVGGETLERSWPVVRSGGRLVTIAASSEAVVDERAKQAFLLVEPDGQQLKEIAAMLETGTLQAIVDAVVPFDQADAAFSRQLSSSIASKGCGKMVLTVYEAT